MKISFSEIQYIYHKFINASAIFSVLFKLPLMKVFLKNLASLIVVSWYGRGKLYLFATARSCNSNNSQGDEHLLT